MYDYVAETEEELSISIGETLDIVKQQDDGWWYARNAHGRLGLVPSNYLRRI